MLGDMAAAGSVKTPAPFVVLEAYRLDDSSLFQISHPALDLTQSKARELGDAQRRGPAEPPIVIDLPAQSEHHDEAVSPDFPYGKLGYKPLRDRGDAEEATSFLTPCSGFLPKQTRCLPKQSG